MPLTARQVARRMGLFFLPIGLSAAYLAAMYLVLDFGTFAIIGVLMALYLFTPVGKYLLIPGALLVGIPGWMGVQAGSLRDLHGTSSPALDIGLVAFSVAFVDAMTSLFLVCNFDIVEAIPVLGRWLKRLQERGRERLRGREGGEKLAFLGLAGFVSLSVQGSGGVSATILGRVAGMRASHVVGALLLGSVTGCTAIAALSYYAGGTILDSFGRDALEVFGLCVLAAALVYLACYYRKG